MKILLLEDDAVLGDVISGYLARYYEVDHCFDANEAYDSIESKRYDMYIFDINLPDQSGTSILASLRELGDMTPTLMITAYTDTNHLKEGFDAGAHDYLKKPFELEELRLRIENLRNLFCIRSDRKVHIAQGCSYLPSERTLYQKDKLIRLKPKEAKILEYFISHPNRLIANEELVGNVWEFDEIPSDATLRSYIRTLRAYLGPEKIKTVRGEGYRYESA